MRATLIAARRTHGLSEKTGNPYDIVELTFGVPVDDDERLRSTRNGKGQIMQAGFAVQKFRGEEADWKTASALLDGGGVAECDLEVVYRQGDDGQTTARLKYFGAAKPLAGGKRAPVEAVG